ncbi:MAG: hypothetical protein M3Q31_14690 [Actinomycetota bacterium]|nr:hypothetical protein [Actinomycetota bacterium]
MYRARPRARLGAAVALAIGGGLAAWAITGGSGGGDGATGTSSSTSRTATTATPIGPIGLSAKGLRTLTASVRQPVYWVGEKPGYLYELTRTGNGNIFVRYLPPGVKVGSKQAIYLIVATYPFKNALQALKNLKARKVAIPGGGIAIVDRAHPQSVHLAYPGIDKEVEIFDPSPARSLQIAKSGQVRVVAAPASP